MQSKTTVASRMVRLLIRNFRKTVTFSFDNNILYYTISSPNSLFIFFYICLHLFPVILTKGHEELGSPGLYLVHPDKSLDNKK